MEKFEVSILGCGCALPTTRHFNASQLVNIHHKLFMIDCGEGTQIQYRKSKLNFNKLGHIFISHLHGDHCFGLLGLVSTFNLLGRTAELHVYGPAPIRQLYEEPLKFFCPEMNFQVTFHEFDTRVHQLLFEDRTVEVWSLPLAHRIPCSGFLFKEKPQRRHILADMVKFYTVPHYCLNALKDGEDYITPEGKVIPNQRLTTSADSSRSYAYCSDTAYRPDLAEWIQGVDLLYHEATFLKDKEKLAKAVFHSTAEQAARMALACQAKKLIIGHYSARYTDENEFLREAQAIFPNTALTDENLRFSIG